MYSATPAASIVVNDLVAERGLRKPEGRRRLNEAGRQAVDATAAHVAALVDELLDRTTGTATSGERVSGK
jgi:hypothetical protein